MEEKYCSLSPIPAFQDIKCILIADVRPLIVLEQALFTHCKALFNVNLFQSALSHHMRTPKHITWTPYRLVQLGNGKRNEEQLQLILRHPER